VKLSERTGMSDRLVSRPMADWSPQRRRTAFTKPNRSGHGLKHLAAVAIRGDKRSSFGMRRTEGSQKLWKGTLWMSVELPSRQTDGIWPRRASMARSASGPSRKVGSLHDSRAIREAYCASLFPMTASCWPAAVRTQRYSSGMLLAQYLTRTDHMDRRPATYDEEITTVSACSEVTAHVRLPAPRHGG